MFPLVPHNVVLENFERDSAYGPEDSQPMSSMQTCRNREFDIDKLYDVLLSKFTQEFRLPPLRKYFSPISAGGAGVTTAMSHI